MTVAPEKCLTRILRSFLTFLDIFQRFNCLSILSPNITMDFLLFELMSWLLVDELSSLLPAFFLADEVPALLCNGVGCSGSMYVKFCFCSVLFLECSLFF